MIYFFRTPQESIIATQADHALTNDETDKLCWLYGGASLVTDTTLSGHFVGPRREMITPWSTNAVEITQNMAMQGIVRIEEYYPVASAEAEHDPMLQRLYDGLNQDIFTVNIKPAPIQHIEDLEAYNEQEGLALSPEEIEYLHDVERQLGRTQKSVDGQYHDRTIDIDLLHYDDLCIRTEKLTIPHPLIEEREFVKRPLSDLLD